MVAKQPLTVYQGSDFRRVIELKDELGALMDLTGYEFRGQAKPSYSAGTPSFSFVFTLRDQVADKGLVDMHIPALSTAILALSKTTKYIYDIEMVLPSGDVKRILEGELQLHPEVTK